MPSKALPMAPAAFEQWCRARALAPSTCDYLSTIRGSEAVRRVTSRANNVSGAYPSRKMGVTIQFESQNPELWAIVAMDRDESVLEFFEQPDTFKIRYLDKSGKKMGGHYYTSDFLVLRNDSVCFEEWKREDDLKRLAAHYPFRYQPQEDGSCAVRRQRRRFPHSDSPFACAPQQNSMRRISITSSSSKITLI